MRARTKLPLLLLLALVSLGVLFGATQPWVSVQLSDNAAAFGELTATGQELNSSLSPVALAGLAATLALSIAGRVFRLVLGGVAALLGVAVAAIAAAVVADPLAAASVRLTGVTGLTGHGQDALVVGSSVSPWPSVVVVLGVLLAITGIGVLVFGAAWKSAGRKYRAPEAKRDAPSASAPASVDRIAEWDAMNEGEDPSREDDDSDHDVPPLGSQEMPSKR